MLSKKEIRGFKEIYKREFTKELLKNEFYSPPFASKKVLPNP
jgi:hypothetical protein